VFRTVELLITPTTLTRPALIADDAAANPPVARGPSLSTGTHSTDILILLRLLVAYVSISSYSIRTRS
jgi:hypothetical protein